MESRKKVMKVIEKELIGIPEDQLRYNWYKITCEKLGMIPKDFEDYKNKSRG